MKLIQLSQDRFAQVDDADYEFLNQWKWQPDKDGYARRAKYIEGKWTSVIMHRVIMNTPKGMQTDHIDLNKLNNQKSNLRICTSSQNAMNKKKRKLNTKTSIHRGAYFVKKMNRWKSSIRKESVYIHLGYFHTEAEAAHAYNAAALELFGEFAHLNIIS